MELLRATVSVLYSSRTWEAKSSSSQMILERSAVILPAVYATYR